MMFTHKDYNDMLACRDVVEKTIIITGNKYTWEWDISTMSIYHILVKRTEASQ